MLLRHNPLTTNDLRQCLRIATGGTIGFTLCKLFGWSNGVFFTVTPMLLLGLVPVMSGHAMRQLLASSAMAGLEVGLLGGFFGSHPGLMMPIVFLLFLYRFAAMSRGSLFLFGANGVLSLSIMLHFASYPGTDLNDLIFSNFWATGLSVVIAYLMTALWPDVEPRPAYKPGPKAPHRMRHEALLGASIATLSFLVFQIFDLRDSMSAQATTLLLLFPMHWNGALDYARKRALGTLLGVSFGVMVQLFLYDWSGLLILIVPLLWIGLMLFAQAHVKEASGSGVGFGAMTTLGILFGQYLTPGNDLIFSALYRVSSIFVAIVATLFLCYLLHKLLNSFEATRFGY
uniref:1,4-alpha-glucan branching protein n=1 Tax=Shewanella sp. (strain MR-7) TaxID=60481 RepID=Q0HZD4_SHESR